jgi:PTS system nitrogen regulatory IIA component
MDLEVKEVSQLLNVPESILLKWIQEGKMPAYYIQNRYRMNRAEIEDFLLKHALDEESEFTQDVAKTIGKLQFNLYRAINKGDVLADIPANSKASIIKETMKLMAPKLKLDPEILAEVFMQREKLAPTALGQGFAVPHARDFHLPSQNDVVTVVFLNKPIEFDALDGEPVHTLFFLLASDDKQHLSLLAKIAHLVKNESMAKMLLKRPSKPELLETIKAFEARLLK